MSTTRFPSFSHLIFRMHALRQMFQRRISGDDIRELLEHGAIIEDYPNDNALSKLPCVRDGQRAAAPLCYGIQ